MWSALLSSAAMDAAVSALAKLTAEPGKEGDESRQKLLTGLAGSLLDRCQGQALETLLQASGFPVCAGCLLRCHYRLAVLAPCVCLTNISCWPRTQALSTPDAGGTAACLLARVQLQRGGAATIAWRLLSACLPAACCSDPQAVQAVLSRMFEEGEYQQVGQDNAALSLGLQGEEGLVPPPLVLALVHPFCAA